MLALLAALAVRLGPGKSLLQGGRARQGIPVERLAEVGELAVVAATKGRPITRRGREDDRVVVAKRINERACVAGRDDNDLPFDPGSMQRICQVGPVQVAQRDPRVGYRKRRVVGAVRGQGKKQNVFLDIHPGRNIL